MYSWELNDYISSRNNSLSKDEYLHITDFKNNPQITRITYSPFEDNFTISTSDDYTWKVNIHN